MANLTPVNGGASSGGGSFLTKLLLYPFLTLVLTLVLILIIGIPNVFYTVEADERGVVMRFGSFNRFADPGLHFKVPFGIEEVRKVQVRKMHVEEFGYKTLQADVRSTYGESDSPEESVMLTGDLNVANVEWTIHYQIRDPKEYLFNVRDVRANMRDISQAVMREVIGDRSITEVINIGRVEIADEAMLKMQGILDGYKMGIRIDKFLLQNVTPPDEVKASFNEVNSAKQEAEQIKNEAMTQYNNIIPKAKGSAEQVVSNAKAYKADLVNHAEGDSKRFAAFYEEYKKAPEITRQRLYFEKLKGVFKKAKQVYIVDPNVKGIVPLMNLNGGTP